MSIECLTFLVILLLICIVINTVLIFDVKFESKEAHCKVKARLETNYDKTNKVWDEMWALQHTNTKKFEQLYNYLKVIPIKKEAVTYLEKKKTRLS